MKSLKFFSPQDTLKDMLKATLSCCGKGELFGIHGNESFDNFGLFHVNSKCIFARRSTGRVHSPELAAQFALFGSDQVRMTLARHVCTQVKRVELVSKFRSKHMNQIVVPSHSKELVTKHFSPTFRNKISLPIDQRIRI